jgi:FMN-dependent NADH-azoreductase
MAKLLYIQASPRSARSKSSRVATSFIENYQELNPQDTITTLNIFREDLPPFDGFAVQAKYSIMHGEDHTPQEKQAWGAVEKVISQFKAADKYILSLPMWNFGIPYRLKHYFDLLIQPGYTFSADENGYAGLVRGKPIVVVYARGGAYPEGSERVAYDMQKKYVELVLGFIGFEDVQAIVVEPTLQGQPEDIQNAIQTAVKKAQSIAKQF